MMPRLNILMLGGAKRVSIGRMFIEAGRRHGIDIKLFSYELDDRVPIASIAEIIKGMRWGDEHIVEDLTSICKRLDIKILLPFVDGAVEIAAKVQALMPDVFAPVSSPEVCREMFDKSLADKVFEACGMPRPKRYNSPDDFVYPVIAKPATGSASRGIVVLKSPDDLFKLDAEVRYIFQEYIAEREEFTVDCYVTRLGEITASVPRRRLEVLGGEVTRTVTVDDREIKALSLRLLSSMALRGAVTIQFIREAKTGRTMIMEVNPRLGGGAVCAVHAGADIPEMILAEALGRSVGSADYLAGVEIVRYMQEVAFKP